MKPAKLLSTGVFAAALAATLAATLAQARAEVITWTITLGSGQTIPVPTSVANSTYSTVDLSALNAELAGAGSPYQFTTLNGGSNFPGSSAGGVQSELNLNGVISVSRAPLATDQLTITESEGGFAFPNGVSGFLRSISGADYNMAAIGSQQTVFGSFNVTNTSSYHLISTGTIYNNQSGSALSTLDIISARYTLDNTLTFDLGGGTDTFFAFSEVAVPAPKLSGPAALVALLLSLAVRRLCRGHAEPRIVG
jgi:hypothetical protein